MIGAAPTKALGSDPEEVEAALNTCTGFWTASVNTDMEDIAATTGLDQALFLVFGDLAKRIFLCIGIPMICIVGPINCFFGGGPAWASGDYLDSLSISNVERGSKLYWMHAIVVWYVVIIVDVCVHNAQQRFLELRFKWLQSMCEERSNTLLIEGIPDEYRSDEEMRHFFCDIFGSDQVKSAYVVKHTEALRALVERFEAATQGLAGAKAQWSKDDEAPEKRPKSYLQGDLIDYHTAELEATEPLIIEERARIQSEGALVGGVNTKCGFVTFTARKVTQMAATQVYSKRRDQWVVSLPPEPEDIIWADLQRDSAYAMWSQGLGVLAIGTLLVAYTPTVISICRVANAIPAGPFQTYWNYLAPTLGLKFMMAFLPTFVMLILKQFFIVKAEVWAQKSLQVIYFWFQVLFVVCVSAIGDSEVLFLKRIFADAREASKLLSSAFVLVTHFYMNFVVFDSVGHAMDILRPINLSKFVLFKFILGYEDEEARKLSEPEDQDYYGIGSRSARATIILMIGVVFGSICPLMNFLAWVDFALLRIVHGYQMSFSEGKKSDYGGLFWVEKMKQVYAANFIYCLVMVGVIHHRAIASSPIDHLGPTSIALPSLLYVLWSLQRFESLYSWETLPITTVSDAEVGRQERNKTGLRGKYVQSELIPW
eukprot:TRINITY_DN3978_c1_g1_i2.p1 TRINITY_DN3978_c1_g1~~TRINITY_DN3978_c1_g1_i2.p1  ORF type:complete len:654 (-),score=69.46 TRINITY_DN3978_c1_g1_i2:147-2108(-)